MAKIQIPVRKSEAANEARKSVLQEILSKEIHLQTSSMGLKKKQAFYNDLNILLGAGLDIISSFEIIENQISKSAFKTEVHSLKSNIIKGMTLSQSMEQSRHWTLYETYSVKIGEEAGQLNAVLQELARFFSRRIEQQRKMSGAFTYPVLVILTAVAAVFFMMRFVVPMFEDVFKRFKGELPKITRVVIYLSHNLGSYMGFILLFIITLIFLWWMVRKKDWFRSMVCRMQLRIPFFGDLIRKLHMSRFCMSMELLVNSRTPLNQALGLSAKMVSFFPLQQAILRIEQDIVAGKSLYMSMGEYKIFDAKFISLIRVGEEVNKLGQMFSRIKKIYDDEIDHKSSMMGTVMEPMIIIFVGLFVGLVLVAMYLPMFQMSTSIAQ